MKPPLSKPTAKQLWSAAGLVLLSALLVGCPKKTASGGGDNCTDEFAAGQPQANVDVIKLCRNEYISVYDPQRKVPLVVAEKLQPNEFDGSVSRADNFKPDPDLSAPQSASLNDYRKSGYARGHMAPAADFTSSDEAMNQSFYLSNMVPQDSGMNSGIWASLESATRSCAKQLGSLYVMTGPIFEGKPKTIGDDQVAVPSSIYKIVVSGNGARAFILPNRKLPPARSNFLRYAVTVDEVQRATGLTFFPNGGVNLQAHASFCGGSYGS
ncbi:DNA/RNA non-specific endonuclease [Deinococcus psychrotolerans]|uniref:DNA/RNA non-specific endonuclease n=1 Tax=Deinococcus psychrotolerans TaxID=2489213 RepID=A0A3G8Y8Y2_9DEIO|nr:DNA/RNA non-specific endonuclease [Deinococcus psychrotolerans]AZI41635.1 DNA/RNA non-specific endonuclease [Deinococcus psychrotolerans]